MTLYNKLTRTSWAKGDFDSGTHNLTGTIYSNDKLTDKFDLTGYTIEVVLWDRTRGTVFKSGLTGAIVSATDGTWKYIVTEGDLSWDFTGEVHVILTKSGTELTAISSAESADFLIYSGK